MAVLCAAGAWVALAAIGAAAAPRTHDELRAQRRQMASRNRRLIFNSDGDEPVYECPEPTADAILRARYIGLEGSHVDAIFYCTWSSGFGMFTHFTRFGEVFTARSGIFRRNQMPELLRRGIDPLAVVASFARRNGMEIFWSMRMNDVHDGSYPELFPKWKARHPELLLGSRKRRPPKIRDGRAWAGVDYTHKQVRDRCLRFFQEVCHRYDIDGVEMDFFRHPVLFRRHAWEGQAGERERNLLTSLVRRIRKMTEAAGLRRGRPILIAARVPDSVEYCRAIGIDIERWLAEGLIDILVVGGYFRLNPWRYSVKLAHRCGVPVYACLSESRLPGMAGRIRRSAAAYRARAMDAWAQGVDGIYVFNFNYIFKPKHSIWRELGDPAVLAPLPKTYFATYLGPTYADIYLPGGSELMTLSPLCVRRPAKLEPGRAASATIYVGDNVRSLARRLRPVIRLGLQFKPSAAAEDVSVSINGTRLADPVRKRDWLEFPVPPSAVRRGANKVTVAAQRELEWTDVRLDISYEK